LSTFPGIGGLSFALAPGACSGTTCAALVQLRRNGQVIDTSALDFAASSAEFRKATAEKTMGAGDPLASGQLPAWIAGDGETTVATTARSMKLSPEEIGLLVDQSGGFEHVKRRHYLFAAIDDELRRIWTGEEGAGPAWSATILVDAGDGRAQDIVYLTGFQPGGADPDAINAKRYHWDAAQKMVIELPPGPLHGVVVGDFGNVDAARTAAAQPCFSDYSALRAHDLGLTGSRIVLAAITTEKALADAALKRTDDCAKGITRRTVEVNLAAVKP
jgi:hypothetical protein